MIKNVIKLSLVAATAVAGISTVSSASKLEDAVKNTDLTGYVRYRLTDGSNDFGESNTTAGTPIEQTHEYKTVFNVKSKVNDMVTANVKVAQATTMSDATGDQDPSGAIIKHANFIFNTGFATVTAGKQGLASPFVDAGNHQGSGVKVVLPLGAVNLAAAWYGNTDLATKMDLDNNVTTPDVAVNFKAHNLVAVGVTGKAGPVDFGLWGAQLSDSGDANADATTEFEGIGFTAMNVNVGATIGTLKIEVNHASMKQNLDEDKGWTGDELTQTQSRVIATIDAGTVKASIGVITTGEDGGEVTFYDTDAKSNFYLQDFNANSTTEATIFYFGATMPLGAITLGAGHMTTDDTTGNDTDNETDRVETKISAKYAFSKNFYATTWVTQAEINDGNDDTEDAQTKYRLEMKYSF